MPVLNARKIKHKKLANKIMIDITFALQRKDLIVFLDSYFKDLISRKIISNFKYYVYSKKIEINVLLDFHSQEVLLISIKR